MNGYALCAEKYVDVCLYVFVLSELMNFKLKLGYIFLKSLICMPAHN